jgi:hypothetical protein
MRKPVISAVREPVELPRACRDHPEHLLKVSRITHHKRKR